MMMPVQFKMLTLEPVIFLFIFGWSAMSSSRVETNLLMWKICHLDMNISEVICLNLTHHEDVQAKVQISANNFQMVGQWVGTVPSLIYSFFVGKNLSDFSTLTKSSTPSKFKWKFLGSLSDDYGRLPCILFPLIGVLIGNIFSIINVIWIRDLPTWFFYLTGSIWYCILGGNSVYYLGTYGFGSVIAKDENRASLLGKSLLFALYLAYLFTSDSL